MYQQATIIGNVGRDAEIRYTPTGEPVCDFSVAVNKTSKRDGQKHEVTTWFKVTVWGTQAEVMVKFVRKSMLIMCVGEIRASAYINKSGQAVASLELVANNIKFLSRVEGEQAAPDQQQESQHMESGAVADF